MLKGKVRDFVDSWLITLFLDSFKALTNQVSTKGGPLERNNLEIHDDEESADSNEEWMLLESREPKSKENGLSPRWPSERQL